MKAEEKKKEKRCDGNNAEWSERKTDDGEKTRSQESFALTRLMK